DLVGGNNNDTLKGGADDDRLWGQDGVDRIFGEHRNDQLIGGESDDFLSGGWGADQLWGQAGKDGLFGGQGGDTVNSGSGADRILSWQTGAGNTDPDTMVNQSSADATVIFRNSQSELTNSLGTYLPQAWTHSDIERLDAALSVLHQQSPETELVKQGNGNDYVFIRHGGDARGFFQGGDIHLTNMQFDNGENWLRGYTLHEIGHAWQGIGDLWVDFLATEDGLISSYAATNDNENFAETFSGYFADKAGWDFYNGTKTIDDVPEKKAAFDTFLASL
ncbi:MAG: hypothetical protein VX438_03775, partial [Planctomycetota bacterium]|nr:hypothetical protein [Planctomycetota bacterium]